VDLHYETFNLAVLFGLRYYCPGFQHGLRADDSGLRVWIDLCAAAAQRTKAEFWKAEHLVAKLLASIRRSICQELTMGRVETFL